VSRRYFHDLDARSQRSLEQSRNLCAAFDFDDEPLTDST
jgi:hypothetical protein